jgi:HK97 family phage major capsid protein
MAETKNTLDRGGEEYRGLFQDYLRHGTGRLTDAEVRALSNSGTGLGNVLAPTGWSDFIELSMRQDTILSKVRKVTTAGKFTQPINVADATVNSNQSETNIGTESWTAGTALALPQQGSGGSTTYTFSLKKVTAWTKVSNEILEDSTAATSIEEFVRAELVAELITQLNSQILIGDGSTGCQGAFNSAKAYSRTASTGVSTSNKASDILAAAWGSSNSALSPMAFESWKNSVAVINSRLTGSFDSTFFPPLFPLFVGNMQDGTSVEGLPTVYHRLSATTPAAGDTLVMFFDPTKYLLATSFRGFSVTRLSETYSGTDQTAFVASVRADGCLLHTSGVLNVNRA